MSTSYERTWEPSFIEAKAQRSYNATAPEALVRTAAYFLRNHGADLPRVPRMLDLGCGAGETLAYFAARGVQVSGIDVSPTAIELARANLNGRGLAAQVASLQVGSIESLPFASNSFELCTEAMVFQHLERPHRPQVLAEVHRVLAPGGALIAYGHAREGHAAFERYRQHELPDDPGSVLLSNPSAPLTDVENIGLVHFFAREEWQELLGAFSVVDLMLETYELPREEASRRGYEHYRRAHWIVYARK